MRVRVLISTLATALVFGGCSAAKEKAKEKLAEKALEVASGGKVTKDGNKTTIKTADGTTTIDQGKDGNIRFKTDKGEGVVDVNGKEAHVKTKDGTFHLGQQIPVGFPLPVLEGAKVLQGMNMSSPKKGKKYVVSLHAEKTSVDDAVKFYEKALGDKGLKPEKVETTAGATKIVVLKAKKGQYDTSLSIMKQKDKPGSMVTLSWGEKPD